MKRKIAIIGRRGSGKTTLAIQLSRELGIPSYHMDNIIWDENWKEKPKDEVLKYHNDIISEPEWIIDGHIEKLMENRLDSADTIIYLDHLQIVSNFRFIKRYFTRLSNKFFKLEGEMPEDSFRNIILILLKAVFYDKRKIYLEDIARRYQDKILRSSELKNMPINKALIV